MFAQLNVPTKRIVIGVLSLAVLLAAWMLVAAFTRNNASTEQERVAQNAGADAAKSENPFQAENPLSGVEANPFEKTKKVLNPFE